MKENDAGGRPTVNDDGGVGSVGGHAKSGAEISDDLKQGERRPRNVSVWITMGKKENLP